MRIHVAMLVAVAALPCAGIQAQGSPQSDSAKLQGTWVMISGAADGVPMPAENVRQMKRVASGIEVRITMNDEIFFTAIFKLKPSDSPKQIDYQMTGGPTAGSIQRGIYRIKGDTAWFCFASPGQPRATEFNSAPGDKRTLSVWVRRD